MRYRSFLVTSLAVTLTLACVVPSALAKSGRSFAQNHPRRAEVLGRDRRLNNRIQADRGQLGGRYGQLSREDRGIRRQEQADARANGGHITPGEKAQLNHEENHVRNQLVHDYNWGGNKNPGGPNVPGGLKNWNGGKTFAQNHPRRAEVLGRDQGLNNEITADKGDLGGHYGQLSREDRSIARQEQKDARLNGGYITKGEQNQLNKEENHVQNQINRDDGQKP